MEMKVFSRLMVCFIFFSFPTLAQEAEVIVPVGHIGRINVCCYDPLSRILATGAGEINRNNTLTGANVKMWNIEDGTELLTIAGFKAPVNTLLFSKDAAMLVAGTNDGALKIWDVKNENKRQELNTGTGLKRVFFTHGDRRLLCVGDEISSWSVNEGKEIFKSPPIDRYLNDAAYQSDLDMVAIASPSPEIDFYRSGRLIARHELFSKDCRALAFTAQNKLIAIGADQDLSGRINIRMKLLDIFSGKYEVLKELPPDQKEMTFRFSADGLAYTSANEQVLMVHQVKGNRVISVPAQAHEFISSVTLARDQHVLFAAYGKNDGGDGFNRNEVRAIDLTYGTVISRFSGNVSAPDGIGFSKGDSVINTFYHQGKKQIQASLNIKNGMVSSRINPLEPNHEVFSGKNFSASAERNKTGQLQVEILNLKKGKIAGQLLNTSSVLFSGDEQFILTGSTADLSIRKLRSSDLKVMQTFMQVDTVLDLHLMKSGKYFVTGSADRTARIWDMEKKSVIKTFRGHEDAVNVIRLSDDERLLVTAGLDKMMKIWDIETGKLLHTLKGHTQRINALRFSKDQQYLLSSSEDHSTRLWNLKTAKELARYYAVDSTDFMISTTEGYYMSTPEAARKLRFKLGAEVFSFRQFDLQFNRPDKVMELIGTIAPEVISMYRRIYYKRLRKMNFDPEKFEFNRSSNVPEVQIQAKKNMPEVTGNRSLKFTVVAIDARFQLERLNIYLNGVPLYGVNGFSLREKKAKKVLQPVRLNLSFGKNLIEVSVLNEQGIESLKDRFIVTLTGVEKKPELYVISIGLSRYAEQGRKLSYADKDARDIAALFASRKKDFEKINVYTVLNEEVTRKSILDLKKTLLRSGEDDEVIVFYAGHGIVDRNLDYYLSTYDMNFTDPARNGILYAELEGLLDNIPARKKILLIDACHSGEIDKEDLNVKFDFLKNERKVKEQINVPGLTDYRGRKVTFEMMRQWFVDLRISTGSTVLSSTDGIDYSLESNIWNNGAFTFCILKGLKNRKADRNQDGKVMISELLTYVKEEVPKLTEQLQKPVSRMENLVNDIQIW